MFYNFLDVHVDVIRRPVYRSQLSYYVDSTSLVRDFFNETFTKWDSRDQEKTNTENKKSF